MALSDQEGLDAAEQAPDNAQDITQLDVAGLLALRAQVDARLPPLSLAELNLEQETVLQYHAAKALMSTIVVAVDVPANQKAQVANSCASVLEQLVKMQTRLYTAERVKALETALIRTLKTLPEATQAAFFEAYEKAYAAVQEAG